MRTPASSTTSPSTSPVHTRPCNTSPAALLLFLLLLASRALATDADESSVANANADVALDGLAAPDGSALQTSALQISQRTTMPLTGAAVPPGGLAASQAVQTMLWAGRPALRVGLGLELTATGLGAGAVPQGQRSVGIMTGSPAASSAMLLAVGMPAGRLGQLSWQTPLSRPTLAGRDTEPRQMRFSLTLVAVDPYADLRRGMLTKLELSSQTALALRPRGGKLLVQLTSRW